MMCTTSVHNTTQNSSDNLPSYLQTNIIAQMLSIRGEGIAEQRAGRHLFDTAAYYIASRVNQCDSSTSC